MTDSSFPAALDGDWHDISDETARLLTERIYDFGVLSRKRRVRRMRAMALPFFAEHILCDMETTQMGQATEWVSCLYGSDGARALTGDSAVIHGINGREDPNLADPALEMAYLQFFCRFVHGDEGPFEIVTGPEQVAGNVAAKIAPPRKDAETGLWSASVLYGGTLFEAAFKIETNGQVNMESDTPVAEDVGRVPDVIFDKAARRLRREA
ncbi:hypothetical protein [Dinoroseobacter sp. S124A]|uniref:hypothetical protein n=1 Tax=Dinoroseobacter sp. S124A TaxID=3415128 RepID=UPI003C7DA1DE